MNLPNVFAKIAVTLTLGFIVVGIIALIGEKTGKLNIRN